MNKRFSDTGDWRVNGGAFAGRAVFLGLSALACLAILMSSASAQIVNEATAGGSFNGAAVTSNSSTVSVPLAPAKRELTVSVVSAEFDGGVADGAEIGPGDMLTFKISVANTGNVTLSGVAPRLDALGFAGQPYAAESFSLDAGEGVKLAPGETYEFTANYVLRAQDAYSAAGVDGAVVSQWSASAEIPSGAVEVRKDESQVTIAAAPALEIVKSFTISKDEGTSGSADVGDLITYRYVVHNTGNVPLSSVHVVDRHETGEAHAQTFDSSSYAGPLGDEAGQWNLFETTPASFGTNADEDSSDAVFDTLGVGGIVTFSYVHRVTQEEFDAQ